MWGQYDISVFILEHDIFSRHSIAGCLGWDRRTHVAGQASAPHELFALLARAANIPRIDVILVDTSLAADPPALESLLRLIADQLPKAKAICMAPSPDPTMAHAAARSGACAYFVREQVGLAIASAVCVALHKCFTVTHELAAYANDRSAWPCDVHILPERRHHPELPQRIEQALELCVLDGLPAEVAADEMGVSTNTIRSYVKEGYRILEAEDGRHYPWTMSPMERAFLRISSLDGEDGAAPPEQGEFVA
jgi:DNA-binding NarL/FixJ family response regulator